MQMTGVDKAKDTIFRYLILVPLSWSKKARFCIGSIPF